MNQKVLNDLIEKSTEYLTDSSRYSSNVKLPHLQRDKLVEMTIEKCCEIMLQSDNQHDGVDKVKKYFGVS